MEKIFPTKLGPVNGLLYKISNQVVLPLLTLTNKEPNKQIKML
jgi:hypothetical protein